MMRNDDARCRLNKDGMYERICERCKSKVLTKGWTACRYCRKCGGIITREKSPSPKSSESPQWKGGRSVDGLGYVRVHDPEHAFATSNGYVREHIKVVVESIGEEKFRELGGAVHHINGDKTDNSLENLWACSVKENADMNKALLDIAFELVRKGHIVFSQGQYTCPLLSNEEG